MRTHAHLVAKPNKNSGRAGGVDTASAYQNMQILGGGAAGTRILVSQNTWMSARAFTQRSSGKYYWEVIGTSLGDLRIGAISLSSWVNSSPLQYTTGSWACDGATGLVTGAPFSPGLSFTGFTWAAGSPMMFAFDMDNNKVWVGIGGTWSQGNPGTGSSPPITGTAGGTPFVPFFSMWGTCDFTVRLSGGFSYPIPSGFSAWG